MVKLTVTFPDGASKQQVEALVQQELAPRVRAQWVNALYEVKESVPFKKTKKKSR